MQDTFNLFVGSYGEESEETIHWLIFNSRTEQITENFVVNGIKNPSFVTVDNTNSHVYAVSEVEAGEVAAYKIEDNKLVALNRQETKGAPCFLEKTNNHLFTANFGNGSVIVHPVDQDGGLQAYTDYHAYNNEQKNGSHIHTIRHIPQTNYYVATDLGYNQLVFYSFEEQEGRLQEECIVALPAGAGPRHIAFHPNQEILYVVNEHDSTICTFSYQTSERKVIQKQVVSTIPEDFIGTTHGAHIVITKDGRHVYASNRGHHSIALFEVLKNGNLQLVEIYKLKGEWPRHFTLSPKEDFLLVANEHTDTIELFKRHGNGTLDAVETSYHIKKPVCLTFGNVDITAF